MIYFKNILSEVELHGSAKKAQTYAKKVSTYDDNNAYDFKKTYCSEYEKSLGRLLGTNVQKKVYRGIASQEPSIIVDPKLAKRKSTSGEGMQWVTSYLSNALEWKKYPKRDRSLICSMDYNKAMQFIGTFDISGSGKRRGAVYEVIPVDGSRWGVCPNSDILRAEFGMPEWKYNLYLPLLHILKITTGKSIDTLPPYEKMRSFLNTPINPHALLERVNEIIADSNPSIMGLDLTKEFLHYLWERNHGRDLTLAPTLKEFFDPDSHGFKLVDFNGLKSFDYNEVWTDSKCLLVKVDKSPYAEVPLMIAN